MWAVCARGWGRTKRREALLLPLPPRFLLARTRCWGKGEPGQEPAWGCPPLGELQGALGLSFPRLGCAECSRMSPVVGMLGWLRGPGCCALGMLQRSYGGQEGAPVIHESLILMCMNRQVPQVGPQHSVPLEQLWSLLESSGSVPRCCGE